MPKAFAITGLVIRTPALITEHPEYVRIREALGWRKFAVLILYIIHSLHNNRMNLKFMGVRQARRVLKINNVTLEAAIKSPEGAALITAINDCLRTRELDTSIPMQSLAWLLLRFKMSEQEVQAHSNLCKGAVSVTIPTQFFTAGLALADRWFLFNTLLTAKTKGEQLHSNEWSVLLCRRTGMPRSTYLSCQQRLELKGLIQVHRQTTKSGVVQKTYTVLRSAVAAEQAEALEHNTKVMTEVTKPELVSTMAEMQRALDDANATLQKQIEANKILTEQVRRLGQEKRRPAASEKQRSVVQGRLVGTESDHLRDAYACFGSAATHEIGVEDNYGAYRSRLHDEDPDLSFCGLEDAN